MIDVFSVFDKFFDDWYVLTNVEYVPSIICSDTIEDVFHLFVPFVEHKLHNSCKWDIIVKLDFLQSRELAFTELFYIVFFHHLFL